ncbi:MAG: hypothetical protein PSX37_02355 [bacterium]|nr:hypothetical protein [bacterium]
MRPRRQPVEPPPRLLKALTAGARRGSVVRINEVSVIPPGEGRAHWRIKTHYGGMTFDAKTGSTPGLAYAAYLDAVTWLATMRAGHTGVPEHESTPVAEFVQSYLDRRGPDGRWTDRTQRDRANDFTPLIAVAERRTLMCRDLNAAILREFISRAGTASRGRTLVNVTGTMLRFGRHAGYFTRDQADAIDAVRWVPPPGYVQQASRRDQAKAQIDIATGGNVMTHQQVADWAEVCQRRWKHGAALIHASALLGTRSGEIRALTASQQVADAGWGNLVSLDRGEILIRHQAGTGKGSTLGLPKNAKIRDIIIPTATPAGFSIRDWLQDRVDEALGGYAGGGNPNALLFPNAAGNLYDENSLRNRVWGPASDELGWRMEEYVTATGRRMALSRFTLHSLRDRYANTAIHEWGYTEEQLLQQGSWQDAETVRRFYAGTTDDTHSSVRRLHGLD